MRLVLLEQQLVLLTRVRCKYVIAREHQTEILVVLVEQCHMAVGNEFHGQ